MIGYVTLGTNNLEKSVKFYDVLFKEELGIGRLMETDTFVAWAKDMHSPSVCVTKPFNGMPATVGNGVMVALALQTPEQVQMFHKRALELGAEDEGAPGPRGEENFYAAYFRDLDGNKLNCFCILNKNN